MAVRVRAPARLHLGFLDLNGDLGRRFGSVGLALDEPALDLVLTRGGEAGVPRNARVATALDRAKASLGIDDEVSVEVREAIPGHAGFGSGTQLALALAEGLSRLAGRASPAATAATALERGNRSGIGVAAFTEGGFIVDGGRDASGRLPPVVARHPFPEEWRVLLLVEEGREGIHGQRETSAFGELPPFPPELAAHLCRVALMQMLPAIALADFVPFSRAVAEIRARVGDHFAPAQGGGRYFSPRVAEAIARLEGDGFEGVGQSSWGPTGFALCPDATAAERARDLLERSAAPLRLVIARGRNRGAEVTDLALEESS
jgi:beta-RFAP synthase